jgi:hypothetical protein
MSEPTHFSNYLILIVRTDQDDPWAEITPCPSCIGHWSGWLRTERNGTDSVRGARTHWRRKRTNCYTLHGSLVPAVWNTHLYEMSRSLFTSSASR